MSDTSFRYAPGICRVLIGAPVVDIGMKWTSHIRCPILGTPVAALRGAQQLGPDVCGTPLIY